MNECRFRPAAEDDLEEIGDFIARDNPQRALTFIRHLREKCAKLAAMPESAPRRPNLGSEIRSRPAGNYVIFYRPVDGGIEVIRILHASRDLDPSLFQ